MLPVSHKVGINSEDNFILMQCGIDDSCLTCLTMMMMMMMIMMMMMMTPGPGHNDAVDDDVNNNNNDDGDDNGNNNNNGDESNNNSDDDDDDFVDDDDDDTGSGSHEAGDLNSLRGHWFLDATTHLYVRSCPSVRPSVRPPLFSNDKNVIPRIPINEI